MAHSDIKLLRCRARVRADEGKDTETLIKTWSDSVVQFAFVTLSMDPEGTHALQKRLRETNAESKAYLAEAMRGHLWPCMHCKHANHVVQAIVREVQPLPSFFLQELKGTAVALANHKYACRIWCRLIEHVPVASLQPMLIELLQASSVVCRNKYGKYVVGMLISQGPTWAKVPFVEVILSKESGAVIRHSALSYVACAILESADVPSQLEVALHLRRSSEIYMNCKTRPDGRRLYEAIKQLGDILDAERAEGAEGADEINDTWITDDELIFPVHNVFCSISS